MFLGYHLWGRKYLDPVSRGIDLNQRAWELTYIERGLPVPSSGPREGYWGARLGPKVPDPILGWYQSTAFISGLLDIDRQRFQRYISAADKKHRVIILGGSVAFGAHASAITKTHFNVIGYTLDGDPNLRSSDIIVLGSGAWKSIQELNALRLFGDIVKPDLVVLLNGLNDLINGATSRTLYGQRIPTRDGSKWTPLYHANDYKQRVADYLNNMRAAARTAAAMRSDMLVVLQPSLVDRENRTEIEEVLLQGSLEPRISGIALTDSYESMRRGLHALAQISGVYFLDCSRIFDQERETTFSDIWHFSDVGHRILGKAMAKKISAILSYRTEHG